MKEALKVECLNWSNLGEDFDESWEFIGTGVKRLSCFVPDELAEKTRKLPDSSNIEELRAYLVASRAADEIIERRTNELNVEWNEFRRKYRTEQIPKSPSLTNSTQPQKSVPAVASESETMDATQDRVSSTTTKSFESNPGNPWIPAGIFGAAMAIPAIALLIGTYSNQQTSSRNNRFAEHFAEQIEKGGPPAGFPPETFEKLKNAAKVRFEQVPGVKEHQRRFEQLIVNWLADHQGQPLPDQQVMSGWFQEMQADFRKELVSSQEFQSFLDRMRHAQEPKGAELAAIERELDRLTQQWALSRLDSGKMLYEFDRKYQRWLIGQGSMMRSRDQPSESVERKSRNLAPDKGTSAFSSSTDPFTDLRSSANRIEPKNTSPQSKRPVGETEKLIKEFMNKTIYQHQGYVNELDMIGWDRILDAERLATDTWLAKSRIAIRSAKVSVYKYTTQMNVLYDQLRKDIDNLKLSAVEKAEAKKAFDRGIKELKQRRDQIWQVEREIVWKYGEVIDFLHRENGNWGVSNGQLYFSSTNKSTDYNKYLGSIRSLIAQREQVRSRGAQKVQESSDRHELTFDCSTDEAYKRSYESILAALSPVEQEKFKFAVLELVMKALKGVDPSSQDFENVANQRISQLMDGKNAAEVIELAAQVRSK